ncbi:uncharacterized protein LOC106728571 [Camelus ferus]|uniref:Uncharacterized protein LOC106728571 n=1 Tax=Camelus ferus TaxID=419612 RepID=A0A8B8UHU3_CAMFR|nr:uncharacterized protein LOC106728571 [Camelus ferus]
MGIPGLWLSPLACSVPGDQNASQHRYGPIGSGGSACKGFKKPLRGPRGPRLGGTEIQEWERLRQSWGGGRPHRERGSRADRPEGGRLWPQASRLISPATAAAPPLLLSSGAAVSIQDSNASGPRAAPPSRPAAAAACSASASTSTTSPSSSSFPSREPQAHRRWRRTISTSHPANSAGAATTRLFPPTRERRRQRTVPPTRLTQGCACAHPLDRSRAGRPRHSLFCGCVPRAALLRPAPALRSPAFHSLPATHCSSEAGFAQKGEFRETGPAPGRTIHPRLLGDRSQHRQV